MRFEALDGVSRVRFVSKGQALENLRADLGREASILEGLERNPLPASFEIELASESRSPGAVGALAARIAESEEIDEVRYGEDWVQGYARILRAVVWLGAGLGAFLMLPFYLEGALQGAVAAAVALAVLYGLFQLGLPIVGDLLAFLLGRSAPAFFGAGEIALLFVMGVGLGLGGAVLSLLRLEETP